MAPALTKEYILVFGALRCDVVGPRTRAQTYPRAGRKQARLFVLGVYTGMLVFVLTFPTVLKLFLACKRTGSLVVSVLPGIVDTPMLRAARHTMKAQGKGVITADPSMQVRCPAT